jgi:carbonic anhydrase/acetyltransferase-like protein (isoleucine patch superfamily)
MALKPFQGKLPVVHPTAFVEESAQVIGDVEIGARSSIWFNSVVRGDVNVIRIGEETNVQDLCCLHVLKDRFGLTVGNRVTVGHSVTLHGCVVEDLCLIGMGATILDGAVIGAGSIVAAGALVTPGTRVPPGSLVMGSPAKVARPIREQERATLERSAANYIEYARQYRS